MRVTHQPCFIGLLRDGWVHCVFGCKSDDSREGSPTLLLVRDHECFVRHRCSGADFHEYADFIGALQAAMIVGCELQFGLHVIFRVRRIGFPVGLGCGEVQGLLIFPCLQTVELCLLRILGRQFLQFGLCLFWRARIQGLHAG